MQTVNELGWVIEGAWSSPSTPEYWASSSEWTSDHMKALRFARREDAEQVAYLMCAGLNVRICEHAWVTNSSRGERSQPATPDTKTGDGRLALPVDAPEIVTMSEHMDELVNRFLAWKLPQTVCADLCVTDSACLYARFGTNLLTATEARQMLEHVLTRSSVGTAWLIETNDPVGTVLYYCGQGDWCSNPNHAMKWPSEEAAIKSEAWTQMQYPGNMRIAGHEWA